jgi:hypothetical protein
LGVGIIVIATVLARLPSLFPSSIDWDEGVYLIMAQRWLVGGLPYVQVWDHHPPGLPAFLALLQALSLDPVLGARIATSGAVGITAVVIHRFCWRYHDDAMAGLAAGLLYIVCISRWLGLAANPVTFDNACVAVASYLLYGAIFRPARGRSRVFAAAFILGCGLQIKYVVFPEAVALCLGYLALRWQRLRDLPTLWVHAGLMLLAGCLPTAASVFYFWMHGALSAFLGANLGSNMAYAMIIPDFRASVTTTLSGLAPIAGALAVIAGISVTRQQWRAVSPIQLWTLLWGAAALADAAMTLKFFAHHYFALYPPVCLACGLALAAVARRRSSRLTAAVILAFAAATPVWVIGAVRAANAARVDTTRDVARFLLDVRIAFPEMKLFVYDYQPVIYALTGLQPYTPYVLGSELSDFARSSKIDGASEIKRLMDLAPDFVVARVQPMLGPRPKPLDGLMAQRLSHYRCVASFVDRVDIGIIRIYAKADRAIAFTQEDGSALCGF